MIMSGIKDKFGLSDKSHCWLVYVGGVKAEDNLKIAMKVGIWGFPELPTDRRQVTRGYETIKKIRAGDLFIIVSGFQIDATLKSKDKDGKLRGRLPLESYIGTFKKISGYLTTSGYYYDDKNMIWPDKIYPHRFKFNHSPLFDVKDVPCNDATLGKSLRNIIRVAGMGGKPAEIDPETIDKLLMVLGSKQKTDVELPEDNIPSATYATEVTRYERDPIVAEATLRRANGYCESCGKLAPFTGKDGEPFLEVHHIEGLASGGADKLQNCVALCPNCHGHVHFGRDGAELNKKLQDLMTKLYRRK